MLDSNSMNQLFRKLHTYTYEAPIAHKLGFSDNYFGQCILNIFSADGITSI